MLAAAQPCQGSKAISRRMTQVRRMLGLSDRTTGTAAGHPRAVTAPSPALLPYRPASAAICAAFTSARTLSVSSALRAENTGVVFIA